MVYFTRSPEPPSSPATAATKGSSGESGLSTPLTGSGSPATHPRSLSPTGLPAPAVSVRRNGALTPSILDSQINSVSVGNGLSSLHDGLLRDTILRRAAQHFPGGSLNFERFETDRIEECVEFIRSLIERSAEANEVSIEEMRKGVKIMATGGGAHKFYELFSGSLGVEVLREDEMECLIEGLKFITLIPDEVYYFSDELIHTVSHPSCSSVRPGPEAPRYAVTFEGEHMAQLPCLLVNIGSGVSIIRVDEDGTFERVSGTSLGGGTLWGLLSLLTPATSFDGEWRCARGRYHSDIGYRDADVVGTGHECECGHAGRGHLRTGLQQAGTQVDDDRKLVREGVPEGPGETGIQGGGHEQESAVRDLKQHWTDCVSAGGADTTGMCADGGLQIHECREIRTGPDLLWRVLHPR